MRDDCRFTIPGSAEDKPAWKGILRKNNLTHAQLVEALLRLWKASDDNVKAKSLANLRPRGTINNGAKPKGRRAAAETAKT